MRTALAVIGLSLVTVGFGLNFGLLYFGIAVYYVRGLEHSASIARVVNHYQPFVSLYTALAILIGAGLWGMAMLYEPTETSVSQTSRF